MRTHYPHYVLTLLTFGFTANAIASSVILEAAYYYPEVPKQLVVNISYEDIAICQTATAFALKQGRLVTIDDLITNTHNHFDFWNATSTLHAKQNSYRTLSDANFHYLMSLITADEAYFFSSEDILFLAKLGLADRKEHQEYIYDHFFATCEIKVQNAKLRSLKR